MKHLHIPTLALTIAMLASCANYHYDTALQQQIEHDGRERTEAWFSTHLPQATELTVETEYFEVFNYITNITTGTFVLPGDSVQHSYALNWETDSCLTDIGMDWDADSIATFTLHGQTISNQDMFPYTRHTELQRKPIAMDYQMLLWEDRK